MCRRRPSPSSRPHTTRASARRTRSPSTARTGFAYAAGTRTCEGGLHVVDVRTPAAPRAAGCFSFDGYTHETQCVVYEGPDTLYRDREICFNSNEDTLTIVDATDKLEPVQLSRTGYGGSAYTHQGWLTEDQRFFLVNDEGDETDVQASDAHVDLGRVGPRCPGPRDLLRRPDAFDRSQPVHPREPRVRVELPQRTARPRRQRRRAGPAARGRVLRHLSIRTMRRTTTAHGPRIRSLRADRWRSTASSRDCSSSGRARFLEVTAVGCRSRSPAPANPAPDQESSFVVRLANNGPEPVSATSRDRDAARIVAPAVGASVPGRVLASALLPHASWDSWRPASEAFIVVTIGRRTKATS